MAPGVRDRLLDLISVRGRAESVELDGRMWQIRVGEVPGLSWEPGQHVRVHVNDLRTPQAWLHPGDVLRTYSIWDYDPAGTLELRVLDHGDGPGARWARGLGAGDEIVFGRPEGGLTLRRPAPYHLFVGEETASVPFGAMLRALHGEEDGERSTPGARSAAQRDQEHSRPPERSYAVLEVATEQDRLALPGEVSWSFRGEAPAADSATLVESVRSLDLPDEPGIAYVAGEARTVQAVRAHLVRDRGWPRRSVVVKPFWTPGRRGMD
ncbi:siderophore-interacting protein [Actinomadura barringtoniae]|uniref:Siderophore-interacting protein n=1 Tax=Actinomadura barringtoniae TaxID=1427535 RepID=A0A939TG28_9ACTN|nr:siderophore-interacting protein [Actinomadura barringtoniae]MBO2455005.1 siderophore-interacting protein [Actinomadura barringtoniae]